MALAKYCKSPFLITNSALSSWAQLGNLLPGFCRRCCYAHRSAFHNAQPPAQFTQGPGSQAAVIRTQTRQPKSRPLRTSTAGPARTYVYLENAGAQIGPRRVTGLTCLPKFDRFSSVRPFRLLVRCARSHLFGRTPDIIASLRVRCRVRPLFPSPTRAPHPIACSLV